MLAVLQDLDAVDPDVADARRVLVRLLEGGMVADRGPEGRLGAPGDWLILASNWAVFSVLPRRGLRRYASAGMMFWVMTFGWLLSGLPFLAGRGSRTSLA